MSSLQVRRSRRPSLLQIPLQDFSPSYPAAQADLQEAKPQVSKTQDSRAQDSRAQNPRIQDSRAQALPDLGPLNPLLKIRDLTDIFVNGPQQIWYEAAGRLCPSKLSFPSEEELRALASRLILAAGGRLDEAYPAADVYTDWGARVHALLPPLSRSGTLLSIRLHARQRPSLRQLREGGMMPQELEGLLTYLVQIRANLLVTGGTGSGKTTLLGALLEKAGPEERLILVEDTAELALDHQHVVSLQTREANVEGKGEVSLAQLICQALRMRPSRLIVGECRGPEVMDMLTAMNTGHSGSGSTVHANSAQALPARLYAMGALAGVSPQALAFQASTALDYIIHLRRSGTQRQLEGVYALRSVQGQQGAVSLQVEALCRWEQGRRRPYLYWSEAGKELARAAGISLEEELEADTAPPSGLRAARKDLPEGEKQ